MKMSMRFLWLTAIAGIAIVAAPGRASADFNIYFGSSGPFSGNGPSNPGPYAIATFSNDGPNQVLLTLKDYGLLDPTKGLTGGEFISGFYFNAQQSSGNTNIPVGLAVTQVPGTPTAESITVSQDASKADGDGFFDILIGFTTSNTPDRFGVDATAQFTITGTGITENSFNYLSVNGGGPGPQTGAIHLQGYGDSAWYGAGPPPPAVPEPSTLAIAGLGALGFVGYGIRRRRAK